MRRASLLVLALAACVPALSRGQMAAPPPAAAAERIEARRQAALAEAAALAENLHERVVCALFPVARRGLPAFKMDSKGALSLEVTAQVDLAAYRAWVSELSSAFRRLAQDVETVRLVKETAGYRFETPEREFDAGQLVVVDGFSDIPKSLGAHVYSFDVATAAALREIFRPRRDKKEQTSVLLQFRGENGPIASARQTFSLAWNPEIFAPFVEARVRYQRFGTGAAAAKYPVLSFKSRKPFRVQIDKAAVQSLHAMTAAWSVCLPNAAADEAALSASGSAALFRDARGRIVRPRAAATAVAPASAAAAADRTATAEDEERRRAAEARALRLRAEAATADAVRAGADAFFASVRSGVRGKDAAAAVESFASEDLSVACTDAAFERPGAPDLLVSGEAYLASQLWAKWRMRAKAGEDGAIVPAEPAWVLAPSFQPPEYVRGAARENPFPGLPFETPPEEPAPRSAGNSFPTGPALLAFGALVLFAGTVVLLWFERLRKRAEEMPSGD